MVCYRRPPSSPHIHSARTAQDGSRKRYSYTSIKNHATVSQAALSNFDWQYDTNTLTRSCLTISRYDDPKKKPCSRSTSEIRSFALDTLRQTRLSDRFLIRRVSIKIFFLLSKFNAPILCCWNIGESGRKLMSNEMSVFHSDYVMLMKYSRVYYFLHYWQRCMKLFNRFDICSYFSVILFLV